MTRVSKLDKMTEITHVVERLSPAHHKKQSTPKLVGLQVSQLRSNLRGRAPERPVFPGPVLIGLVEGAQKRCAGRKQFGLCCPWFPGRSLQVHSREIHIAATCYKWRWNWRPEAKGCRHVSTDCGSCWLVSLTLWTCLSRLSHICFDDPSFAVVTKRAA